MLPNGSLSSIPATIPSLYGPFRRTYSLRSPGLVRGRLHSAKQPPHEAEIGVRLARANKLIDLVETGEVVPRLGRGGRQGSTAGQFDRPGYVAERHEPADWSNWFTHRSEK